jgi:hypothetical protein
MPSFIKQKIPHFAEFCREEGIRTLDTLPYTHFPGVLLQPLGHLSVFLRTAKIAFHSSPPNIFCALAVVRAATSSTVVFFTPASFSIMYCK